MPRLDQLLAHNLGLSRSEVTRLLRRGAVRDGDGAPLREPKTQIALTQLPLPIQVGERKLTLRTKMHLMQHKPVGVVTSRKDGRHPTAWGLLEGAPLHGDLLAVGRLDLDASGLLLWTTEGPLVHALTHPKRAVPRTYQVALAREFTPPPRADDGRPQLILADGAQPRIVTLEPLPEDRRHPALPTPPGTEALAEIVLLDGAYHEVKRIFAALDSHVLCLTRVAHAGLTLPEDLLAGSWIELPTLLEPPRGDRAP